VNLGTGGLPRSVAVTRLMRLGARQPDGGGGTSVETGKSPACRKLRVERWAEFAQMRLSEARRAGCRASHNLNDRDAQWICLKFEAFEAPASGPDRRLGFRACDTVANNRDNA
jgi:hypothetical protein